jgi:branched-chain amino acid transport system ATP-binding protein
MEENLLELQSIRVRYGGVRALDGVDLSLFKGEIVALMGPNGAGKSTVFKAIFGLAPASGQILWHGSPIVPVPHEVVGLGIAFVPQGRRVFTSLTVEENLEVGGFLVKDKKELRRCMDEVMKTFPVLRTKRRARAVTLSGGEQQMLAIARGLMTDPKVLLLDEPTLGLAPNIVKEVFAKVREINERHGTTILVVEHNIKSLFGVVHRAYVLDKGKVVAEGTPKELEGSDILEKVFLGKLE